MKKKMGGTQIIEHEVDAAGMEILKWCKHGLFGDIKKYCLIRGENSLCWRDET